WSSRVSPERSASMSKSKPETVPQTQVLPPTQSESRGEIPLALADTPVLAAQKMVDPTLTESSQSEKDATQTSPPTRIVPDADESSHHAGPLVTPPGNPAHSPASPGQLAPTMEIPPSQAGGLGIPDTLVGARAPETLNRPLSAGDMPLEALVTGYEILG